MGAAATNRARRVVAIGFLTAVVWPVTADRESFPLSTYPIYARARERQAAVVVAVGLDAAGIARPLGLDVIASTDDPLVAQSTLDQAVASGSAGALCRRLADRAAARIVVVEIARERHDLVALATSRPSLIERDVVARCESRT